MEFLVHAFKVCRTVRDINIKLCHEKTAWGGSLNKKGDMIAAADLFQFFHQSTLKTRHVFIIRAVIFFQDGHIGQARCHAEWICVKRAGMKNLSIQETDP